MHHHSASKQIFFGQDTKIIIFHWELIIRIDTTQMCPLQNKRHLLSSFLKLISLRVRPIMAHAFNHSHRTSPQNYPLQVLDESRMRIDLLKRMAQPSCLLDMSISVLQGQSCDLIMALEGIREESSFMKYCSKWVTRRGAVEHGSFALSLHS